MPIDINEDRKLRLIWCKYQNALVDHERSRRIHWKKNTLDEWEQVRRDLESQRRKEIYETRKIVRAEKAEREENERQLREQREEERKLMLSRRRQERKKAQEASPPPLRRSARVHSKTSNDPLASYKRGSMYTKTA
jgi:hypothetical protein